MSELNTMLREHALTGLQAQLDAAVTNGDTVAARKASDEISKLAVSTAPKAAPFGQPEIMASMETKAPWFGIDPKKSAKALEFGKTMNLKKFATAEAFADAVIKAVDEEFKPATGGTSEEEPGEEEEPAEEEEEPGEKKPTAKRRTDAPGEGEAAGRATRSKSGPWTKLSDAPGDVQKDVKRAADKFAPKTKEGRTAFETKALEAHYAAFQRTKGKKS